MYLARLRCIHLIISLSIHQMRHVTRQNPPSKTRVIITVATSKEVFVEGRKVEDHFFLARNNTLLNVVQWKCLSSDSNRTFEMERLQWRLAGSLSSPAIMSLELDPVMYCFPTNSCLHPAAHQRGAKSILHGLDRASASCITSLRRPLSQQAGLSSQSWLTALWHAPLREVVRTNLAHS